MKSLKEYINEAINEAKVDWNSVIDIIQSTVGNETPGATKTKWGSELIELSSPLDLAELQKLIKKNKLTPIKRNDEDNNSAWVGFSVRSKEVEEISFGDGEKTVHLHDGNAEAVTHNKKDFFGAGYCWANAPRTRNYAYECPVEIVHKIYDIVQSKY